MALACIITMILKNQQSMITSQLSGLAGRPSKTTFKRDETSLDYLIVISHKQDKILTRQGQESVNKKQKQEHDPLSSKSDIDLNRSDLTIAGQVAGLAVQLPVVSL